MSTFSALNAATTALWAQRRALDVTGQNIANVNTEGYSRQRTELQSIGGSVAPGFHSTSPGIGAGVSVEGVQRIRDAFLESRGHTEHAKGARFDVESRTLEEVATAFREPGDSGIQSLLTDMWDGWEDVANEPATDAARAQLVQRITTLAGALQSSSTSLEEQWKQTRENLDALVRDVNATATTVAELNKAIRAADQAGLPVNDLADKRDVLVMRLADQVGATVRPGQNGALDVLVDGMSLVSGDDAHRLAVAGPTDPDLVTAADKPRIVTAAGGHTVPVDGSAGGQLSALVTIIPGFRARLDAVAASVAGALNAGQAAGFDRAGAPGAPLLGPAGTVTAANITVLFRDPALIAASGVGGSANLDSGNADRIAQLRHDVAGPDGSYRKLIVELGVQGAAAARNRDIQAVISTQVDAARESVAGVNMDEELSNMLSFQHAYSAAARVITAIDQTLETLIKGTGIVGR